MLESNGRIDQNKAFAMVSTNLEKLLGIRDLDGDAVDMVAYDGGSVFDLSSKVVAVLSPQQQVVNVF